MADQPPQPRRRRFLTMEDLVWPHYIDEPSENPLPPPPPPQPSQPPHLPPPHLPPLHPDQASPIHQAASVASTGSPPPPPSPEPTPSEPQSQAPSEPDEQQQHQMDQTTASPPLSANGEDAIPAAPPLEPMYTAKQDYASQHHTELTLKANEFYNVIKKLTPTRWMVHNVEGEEGIVWSQHLQPVLDEVPPPLQPANNSKTASASVLQEQAKQDGVDEHVDDPRYDVVREIRDGVRDRVRFPPVPALCQYPASMVLENLAIDKIKVISKPEEECDFCTHGCDYGCARDECRLPMEMATGACENCTAPSELEFGDYSDGMFEVPSMFANDDEFAPVEEKPPKHLPCNPNVLIPNIYMTSLFCKYSPYGYIDIKKVQICKPCKFMRTAIVKHRHVGFVPAGGSCMICTQPATERCTGCPLLLCPLCSAQTSTHEGELDFLIYDMSKSRDHIRNDVVLLRKDGGGY